MKVMRLAAAFAAVALVSSARAADKVELGKEVADFGLKCSITGKDVKLSDFKGKVVVVNFINYQCPVSIDTDNRFAKFTADYKDKGVVVLHIDSIPGHTVETIKEQAEKVNLGAAVLRDAEQTALRQFEAKVTPHVFVIGKDGKLAYRGSFDDNAKADKVTKHYVQDAVDALLKGSEVEVKETKAFGCGIRRLAAK